MKPRNLQNESVYSFAGHPVIFLPRRKLCLLATSSWWKWNTKQCKLLQYCIFMFESLLNYFIHLKEKKKHPTFQKNLKAAYIFYFQWILRTFFRLVFKAKCYLKILIPTLPKSSKIKNKDSFEIRIILTYRKCPQF